MIIFKTAVLQDLKILRMLIYMLWQIQKQKKNNGCIHQKALWKECEI